MGGGMSDEKQPNLTPAEQHQQDEGRVQTQIVVTDMTEMAGRALESFGFGNPRTGGRTSFEGHQLNALIDMVENTNPEHLESAGEALWKARDAIRRAAKELKDHLKGVDWQGESGTAFRAFGTGLVAHAEKLGDFADAAGTQITVAGTGLASVKSAMPPRDSRMIQTDVKDILFPARTETNPQYAAALEVEKNRQEAINQINRLASYYSVSEEVLAGQEPPRFDKNLGISMPQPIDVGRSPLPASSALRALRLSATVPYRALRTIRPPVAPLREQPSVGHRLKFSAMRPQWARASPRRSTASKRRLPRRQSPARLLFRHPRPQRDRMWHRPYPFRRPL